MAGEWIPVRVDLFGCPQVVQILSRVCPDCVRNKSERVRKTSEVVGALIRMWSLFDRHTDDGELHGYTTFILDDEVGIDGFAEAVASVGWLLIESNSLKMPEFSKYLSTSAKTRMKDAQRKREQRAVSEKCPENVQIDSDKKRTTEEKRIEEKKTEDKEKEIPPDSPKGEPVVEKQKRTSEPGYDAGTYRFSGHLDTPEVHDAFQRYVAMRKAKGKRDRATLGACEQIERDFQDYSAADLVAALGRSIVSSWNGVFKPDKSTKRPPPRDGEFVF